MKLFSPDTFAAEIHAFQEQGRFIAPVAYSVYRKLVQMGMRYQDGGNFENACHYYDYAVRYATIFRMGLLNDDTLEEHLFRMADSLIAADSELSRLKPTLDRNKPLPEKPSIGVAASQVEDCGGIAEGTIRFIEAFREHYPVCYLSSESNWASQDTEKFSRIKSKLRHVYTVMPPHPGQNRLKSIPAKIVALFKAVLAAKIDILFIHPYPYDIIWPGVLGLIKHYTPIKIVYVNHQDYFFNLGCRYADLIIEYHDTAQYLTQVYRGKTNTVVIPFQGPKEAHQTADTKLARLRKQLGITSDHVVSVTGTTNFKIFVDPELTYFRLLKELLSQEPQLKHILLINSMSKEEEGRVRAIFKDSPEAWKRLKLLSSRPDYMDYYALADLYLCPYPFTGAVANVDAMSLGRPLLFLKDARLPIALSDSMLYPGYRYVADSPEVFLERARELIRDPQKRRETGQAVLKHYRKVYGFEAIRKHYQAILEAWQKEGTFTRFSPPAPPFDARYDYLSKLLDDYMAYIGEVNFQVFLSDKPYTDLYQQLTQYKQTLHEEIAQLIDTLRAQTETRRLSLLFSSPVEVRSVGPMERV